MSKEIIRICILPKEGIENPYQKLMMEGLRKSGANVSYGSSNRFFSILISFIWKKPDWIHFDWLYSFYSINLPALFKWIAYYLFCLQIFLIKRFTKCKIGYTLHNIKRHEYYHGDIDHKAHYFLFKYCDFIRVFNERTIAKVVKEWKDVDVNKFYVQPEGSYVDYYPNEINLSTARKHLKYSLNDFVILCLGSIRPYKGISELIDIFLRYKESNWKLLIAGYPFDEDYTKQIERKCINNCDIQMIIGHQPEVELQYLFNASDVVACAFKQIENSGSVILAMGFKKAVIAPAMGVLLERLKNQTELLYHYSLEESFEVLKRLSPEDLQKIGENNFESLNNHSWTDFINAFKK
jgi:glycosyltransferase involved in cell wall biosynthesis